MVYGGKWAGDSLLVVIYGFFLVKLVNIYFLTEVYFGLCHCWGAVNSISDGFSWTILRCSQNDQKGYSALKIAVMAKCQAKLAFFLPIMKECFVSMVNTRIGINNDTSSLIQLGVNNFYPLKLNLFLRSLL